MHETLPIYCETALNTLGTFPAEPVNAITSFMPVITGLFAIAYLWRTRPDNRVAWILAILTVVTGLGSVAWHAWRTEFTLVIDAVPGLTYFVLITFFWIAYLGNRWIAIAVSALLIGLIALTPPSVGPARVVIFIGVVVLIAVALLVATWRHRRPAFGFGLVAVGAGILAGTLRTLDLHTCDTVPIGTHFFWHLFLAIAAYAGVRLMVALKSEPAAAPN